MKLLNFTVIKLTCCLIIGILLGVHFPVDYTTVLKVVIVGLIIWVSLFFFTDRRIKQTIFLGVLTYVLMMFVGILVVLFHTDENHNKHYTNVTDLTLSRDVKIHVFKTLKPTRFLKKYLGELISIESHKTIGTVLVNIDSTQVIDIDDVLYASVKLTEIQTPLNPHQFDYNAYMKRQQVYHQVYVNSRNSLVLTTRKTLYGHANTIRKKINETLKTHAISEENLSIVNALLLGQRQEVSKETYRDFTSSGAVHILAISGLHIGLLLLLLSWVLKPLTYIKNGKVIVSISIIILLWMYAFVVGMSASVVRAVTMFSLFTISIYSNRLTNTYNTLVISAFLLLLCNPYYIFDIGFQMSYTAVFAIIWIKPQFDKIWQPQSFIGKKLWDVFTVTISAQCGILPLALFYFHQFPGLFFISNMVIIPLLGVLLGLGVITLIFAYFGWIPNLLFELFNQCISWLLSFVKFISAQENFMFSQLPFNQWNLISSLLLIISGVLLWKLWSYKRLVFALISVACVQITFITNRWQSETEEFIVFNDYKSTSIGIKKSRAFEYSIAKASSKQFLESYIVNEYITSVKKDTLRNVYQFHQNVILVVDDKGVYDTTFKPDIIVLTGSPKINLNRLIKVLKPKQIVIDNNNYNSYVNRWKETCLQNKVPFHHTREEGAYVLR